MAKVKSVEESDLDGIRQEIAQASDRTAAIVLASFVERELEGWMLGALARPEKKTVQSLSFYSKIDLGYALGLYGETTKTNLHIIRIVRNDFAHTAQAINFETKEIRDEVEKLSVSAENDAPNLAGLSELRRKYTNACTNIVVRARFEPSRAMVEMAYKVLANLKPDLLDEQGVYPEAVQALSNLLDAIKNLEA